MKKKTKDNRYVWRKDGSGKECLYDEIPHAIEKAEKDGTEDALVMMWNLQEAQERIIDETDAENISACWALVDWIRKYC